MQSSVSLKSQVYSSTFGATNLGLLSFTQGSSAVGHCGGFCLGITTISSFIVNPACGFFLTAHTSITLGSLQISIGGGHFFAYLFGSGQTLGSYLVLVAEGCFFKL